MRLEDVRLARPVPARAVDPPEQIELDLPLVGHRDVARPEGLLAENELGFGGVVLPPVHPDVKPRRLGRVVPLRQGDGVRLHRAIDLRIVGVDLLFAGVPGRRAVAQLFGPRDALIEHHQRVIDGVLGAEQLRIFQQIAARLGEHLDVAHQVGIGVLGLQFLHDGFDLLAFGADLRQLFGLRLDGGSPAPAAPGRRRRRLLRRLLRHRQRRSHDHHCPARKSLHL